MPVQYRRGSQTVWRSAPEAVLVLPISGRDVRALAGAGADLWHLLSQPLTLDQAAHQLAEVYDTSPEKITQEIAPVLDHLVADGVLDRLDSA